VPLIIGNRFHRGNAQWRLSPAHYRQHSLAVMCSGDRVLLIIGNVQCSITQTFAICRLLSLPHLLTLSTGTTGSARSLRISPRLPPYQPTTSSVDQNAEACPHIIPIHSRCFIPLHRHDAYSQSLKDDISSACLVKGTNRSNLFG
jgi:hypothetical protein